MNDYLANFLDAEAHDIHCPSGAGPADLPDGFIRRFDIRSSSDFSNETGNRPTLLLAARVGLARQAQAVLPALGAVLEQVMHLVYALALASIWFGVVISLMFSLFLPTEGMLKTQIDAMLATLKASWMSSFWVGLGLTLVGLASDSGNALAVNAISVGMFVVFSFQIRGAARTMRASVAAASASLGQAPAALGEVARGVGAAARFAGRLGADAAIIGAAAATGNGAELVEAGVHHMRRRLAFSTSGNLVAQAGQRLLLDKAMGPVERWVQNEKDERAIGRSEDEGQWDEQRLGDSSLRATAEASALRRTSETDEEIDTRRAGQVKRQLRQARELGAWEKADALQQQVDSQEIDRLERQIADARQSGDARRISQIPALQRRI